MDKILLVLCNSSNYDELELNGFALFKDDVWKAYLKEVKTKIYAVERDETDSEGPHVCPVGENGQIGFCDFESYKECFKVKTT